MHHFIDSYLELKAEGGLRPKEKPHEDELTPVRSRGQ